MKLMRFLVKSIASYAFSKKESTCYLCYNEFISRESFKVFEYIIFSIWMYITLSMCKILICYLVISLYYCIIWAVGFDFSTYHVVSSTGSFLHLLL